MCDMLSHSHSDFYNADHLFMSMNKLGICIFSMVNVYSDLLLSFFLIGLHLTFIIQLLEFFICSRHVFICVSLNEMASSAQNLNTGYSVGTTVSKDY